MPQSTAISHFVLACTSGYCWSVYRYRTQYPALAYGLIAVNSVLGVWRWGADSGSDIAGLYNTTGILQDIFVLPLIVTEYCLLNGFQKDMAHIHVLVGCFLFLLFVLNKAQGSEVDAVIGIECITLGVISVLHENYYGILAALAYLFSHFQLKSGTTTIENMPALDSYNYGMSFFCYFALRALGSIFFTVVI